jgi:NAD(P)-dependent dehydrogenase (short-subunit alcohol dehydrogenase family)
MTTTLITGANKGIGFETARQLIAAGHTVYLGSRDAGRGRRASEQLGARMVLLDVTDDESAAAAAKAIEASGGLDVLVNNAGIEEYAPDGSVIGAAEVTADVMRTIFETNVFGVVRVTHAFLPLLHPGVAYPASKAAVNMITVQYARAFPDIRINAVEPGYTATDLNRHAGRQSAEQGAEVIVRMAQAGPGGPTGGYFDATGPIAW